MARKKVENVRIVKDLKDANLALAELAALERNLKKIAIDRDEWIDQVKAVADAAADAVKAQIEPLAAGLRAFAEHNRESLFGQKKTVMVSFGRFGFRKATALKTMAGKTWKMILGRLKELKFTEAIRTKEDVNKDELGAWPDERLNLVGARRVETDEFWYEIAETPENEAA